MARSSCITTEPSRTMGREASGVRYPYEYRGRQGKLTSARARVLRTTRCPMKRLVCILAFAVATAAPAFPIEAQASRRPNVVLIMTDDAGYGDFGSYGASDIRTSNIDAIGRAGVRLTDFYANGATCTPTRAGLISGRYQQRFGLEAPLQAQGQADWVRGLPATGGSLPPLLKQRGYTTALVGKWHLGWKEEFSPKAHGFDYFFGFKSAFVDYYQHTAGSNAPIRQDLFENEQPVEIRGYMTDLITQ